MDPTPERLAICGSGASGICAPNNVAWANMMSELGMVVAPTAFHSARTTGLGGFSLSLEASFTHINADATAGGVQYWHQGTQGALVPATNAYSIENTNPDSILGVYSLKARKGLAYGFEIAGDLGVVTDTSLWVGGADLRWALLEGYRTGVLGYFPDISIGTGVRTVVGSSKFFLTTVGIDGQISKPFTITDNAVLTPYLGVQRVIIFADSSVVNLKPSSDPLDTCGYGGPNVPGNKNATPGNLGSGQLPNDGTPICAGSGVGDFNNDTTFNKARIHRWRGMLGLNYRFEVLYLAAQFAIDLTDPSAENGVIGVNGSRQWTTSLEAGVSF
ncbi:MAG TPA: hypothetical protein VHV30_08490 [Polyangiaceae bacterium]|jgi:hypothetical protein|nr:hypothetical protein [Polyangiaceae bacterium]